MEEFVEETCKRCGIAFQKPAREWRRRRKIGKFDFFCSPSCASKERGERRAAMPKAVSVVICAQCLTSFERKRSLHLYELSLGRTRFNCSPKCAAEACKGRRDRRKAKAKQPKPFQNEKSKFKWYVNRATARRQHGEHNLDPTYLQEVWQSQNGTCPFTGWKLVLPYSCNGWEDKHTPESASLDRINNDIGYVRGNVRFIALMANLARQRFEDSDVIRFGEAIHNTNKTGP
jgi:hypothetical protein